MIGRFLNACLCVFVSVAACQAEDVGRLTTTRGTVSGEVVGLDQSGVTVQSGTVKEVVSWAEIIRVQLREPQPTYQSPWIVVFPNGDRMFLSRGRHPVRIDDVALTGRSPSLAPEDGDDVVAPLETIQGLILQPSEIPERRFATFKSIRFATEEGDLFVTQSGDRVTGEYIELARHAFHVETKSGVAKLATAAIRWMRFNPELVSFPKVEGRRWLVRLVDGSRITATGLDWEAPTKVTVVASFGPKLKVAVADVASIQPLGFGLVYLSDLEPADYTFQPFLSKNWKLARDLSVAGTPLSVGGREFDKGIGLHSQVRVTYDLDGQFSRLTGTVGINQLAKHGQAVLRVKLDGEPKWESRLLTANSAPQQFPDITIGQARKLAIEVSFGPGGDIQDHVDIVDAALVPTSPESDNCQ